MHREKGNCSIQYKIEKFDVKRDSLRSTRSIYVAITFNLPFVNVLSHPTKGPQSVLQTIKDKSYLSNGWEQTFEQEHSCNYHYGSRFK